MNATLLLVLLLAADTTPPAIRSRFAGPPPGPAGWHRDPPMIDFICSDDVQLADCSPRRVIFEQGRGIEVIGTARDGAGNTSTTTIVVNYDGIGPSVSIDGEENRGVIAAPRLTIRGRVSDAVSGVHAVYCKPVEVGLDIAATVEGEEFECTVPLAGRNLQTRIEVRAEDRAGNSSHRLVRARADLSAPAISIHHPSERERITSREFLRLLAYVSDENEGGEVRLNGVPLDSASQPIDTYVRLQPGVNELVIEAVDHVGNKSSERLVLERVPSGDPRIPEPVVELDPVIRPGGAGGYRIRAFVSPPRCGYFFDWRVVDREGRPSDAGTFTSAPDCRNQSECWATLCTSTPEKIAVAVMFQFEQSEECIDE